MRNQINRVVLMAATALAFLLVMSLSVKAQDVKGCEKLPGLDFSELEKEYELLKCVYTDDNYIRLSVKPKKDPPHAHNFGIAFYDEDGIETFHLCMFYGGSYTSEAGTPERWETLGPYESKLKPIKNSIIYRIVDDGSRIGPKPGQKKN